MATDAGLATTSHAAWRDPLQVINQCHDAGRIDSRLLQARVQGDWWELLAQAGITLLVTREYEHLVLALSVTERGPSITYLQLPHPSGLVADRQTGRVYVASTRNPNQIITLAPIAGLLPRLDLKSVLQTNRELIPLRSSFLPGSLYLHDLALIGGTLHANAVGQNAIVSLPEAGGFERVWWPRCIETSTGPVFGRNHLQLNSIAAGPTLAESFFSASSDRLSVRRPGHRNYLVDGRGVIFSGQTREPVVSGLTRPHSARLHDGNLWVDKSGFGELTVVNGGLQTVARLPGWTRGLCFHDRVAFVGTSRVLPRFRQYAPGLDLERSVCGLHAVDVASGQQLGSIIWPHGDQIFAVDWLPAAVTSGLPLPAGVRRSLARDRTLFYAFDGWPWPATEQPERPA